MKTFNASDLVHAQAKREAQYIKEYKDILNESRRRFNELLWPLAEKLCELYDTSREVETKPTLSEILTEGSKRIDDAVEAVIARHEEEIAYDAELKKEEAKQIIDQGNSRYFGRSQYAGTLGMQADGYDLRQNRLFQQMGADRRDAMNQLQSGTWI
jgi:hypothetical protein